MSFDPSTAMPDDVKNIVDAVTSVESGGDESAESPQGARGSMQIMPATFKQYAKSGESYDNDADRRSAAVRKILDDYQHFNGDTAKVAAAYIGGRGAVREDGSIRDDVADSLGTTPAAYAQRVKERVDQPDGFDPSTAVPDSPSGFDPSTAVPDRPLAVPPTTGRNWSDVPKDIAVNLFGGAMETGAKSIAALSDAVGAKDTAAKFDEYGKNWGGTLADNGGDTLTGKVSNILGAIASVVALPEVKLVQLTANAGLFAIPAFRDSLHANLDEGHSYGDALAHAVTAFGVNMLLPTVAAKGSGAAAKVLGLASKDGAGQAVITAAGARGAATQLGLAGAEGAGFSAINSISNKAIDAAAGEKNDNAWVDPKDIIANSLAFSILRGKKAADQYRATPEAAPPVEPPTPRPDLALVPEGQETPIGPEHGVPPVDAIAKAESVDEAIAAYQAGAGKTADQPNDGGVDLDAAQRTVDAIEAQRPDSDPVTRALDLFKTPEWQEHRDAQPDDIRRSMHDAEQAVGSQSMPDDMRTEIARKVMEYADSTPKESEAGIPVSAEPVEKSNPIVTKALEEARAERLQATEAPEDSRPIDPIGGIKAMAAFKQPSEEVVRQRIVDQIKAEKAKPVPDIGRIDSLKEDLDTHDALWQLRKQTLPAANDSSASTPQGEVAYQYPGMYGKGMTERNARNEAAKRNRTDPDLIHTAEPVDGLDNPYQVVGRERPQDVLHDITSVSQETKERLRNAAIDRSIAMQQGHEVDPIKRESARLALNKNLTLLNDGKLNPEEFAQAMDALHYRMQKTAAEKSMEPRSPRERGADFVREKLLQAKRRGDITDEAADMAEWFVRKNPALLDQAGISIRGGKDGSTTGQYSPFNSVVTLFKGNDKSTTAVHEVLHHLERMMPPETQDAIRMEYLRRVGEAAKNGTPEMQEYLANVMRPDVKSQQAAYDALTSGKIPLDAYQYMNPSEFWAVNMTRIMEGRYRAGESGAWARTRQWLREALEHIKGALNLGSDAPMLKELNRLLSKGDGNYASPDMLSGAGRLGSRAFSDIEEKKSIYTRLDSREIVHGYSPYVGVELSKLPKGTVADAAAKAFAPSSRGTGKEAAGIIRSNMGQQAYDREQALTKLQGFAKMFDKFSPEDNYKFIDDIENGRLIDNPRLNEAAVALRAKLDAYRDKVRSLGTGKLENFNTNYFPHIYKDPAKAEAFFRGVLSKRSLEGGKGFLKQRKYDSLADAIKPKEEGGGGLTPITDNPVEMVLLKLREMDRYIYGQKIFAELKDAGLVKFYRTTGDAPDGTVKINDKIASVNSPAEEGGMIHRGDYYAPEQAATVINNHLSPGLAGNGFYDAFRGVGNAMNAMQLGLSLFHVGFTTMDAVVSKNALAAMQLRRGDYSAGTKSLFMGTFGALATPYLNWRNGDRLLKAYRGDISDPALAPMVEALQHAGARQRDDLYRNATVNAFKQAARAGRYGEAAVKFLPTLLDYMNKPVFEYLVPRQKFGVFFDMAQDAIEQNPNMDLAEKRAAFGKIWDSVDNRMGELVYDNVFWHRALKDGLMAVTRSVGWNLGTFRELGGGVLDARHIFKDKELSPRTAYVAALPFTAAIVGSVIQYLYTGKGPEDLKDAFFPRDGGVDTDGVTPTRKSLPSYVKDVAEYGHDISGFVKYGSSPLHTVQNKLAPLISTINQMLNNEDYYGGAIRSPGDSAIQQLKDEGGYLLKQIEPFSVRNYQQQNKPGAAGGGIPGYVTSASFYGLAPAPGYITKSAADQESQTVAKMAPSLIKKFREDIRDNGLQDDTIQRMINAGLTPEQRKLILRNSSGASHAYKPRVFGSGG